MSRKPSFAKAVREELKAWRLSFQEESMLLAFAVCVDLRMKGIDPVAGLGLSADQAAVKV